MLFITILRVFLYQLLDKNINKAIILQSCPIPVEFSFHQMYVTCFESLRRVNSTDRVWQVLLTIKVYTIFSISC